MMTADEKNHVISNANEELDRQIVRLDTVFPYITYEISEEARLGSLAHWAYSNKSAAKAATTERPRREAVINRPDLTQAFEAEAASRSEARREAVLARKQRRAHIDADYEESRSSRKTNSGKSRADHATAEQSVAAKRRRVDRPAVMDMGATMERSASGTGSQRAPNKDGGEKKRSRAPNATAAAARKKYVIAHNTSSLNIIDLFFQDQCFQRWVTCFGSLTSYRDLQRPAWCRKPRAQHFTSTIFSDAAECWTGEQFPTATLLFCLQSHWPTQFLYVCPRACFTACHTSTDASFTAKPVDPRSTPRDDPVKPETANADIHRDHDGDIGSRASAAIGNKRENLDGRSADAHEAESAKGRSSKTSTPMLPTLSENGQSRSRPTRSTDPAPKRNTKKTAMQAPIIPSDEESLHEGDDEDEEGEPRYCYCNEISFGEMVACDNDACPREWFHLSCVGLTKPPGKNGKLFTLSSVVPGELEDDMLTFGQSSGIATSARRTCGAVAMGGRFRSMLV